MDSTSTLRRPVVAEWLVLLGVLMVIGAYAGYLGRQVDMLLVGSVALISLLGLHHCQRRQRAVEDTAWCQQQALQASEARQHAIFDASPDAQLISDERGLIVQVNRQVGRLLGYVDGELLGQSIELLVPDRFRAAHTRLHAEFVAESNARRMGEGRGVVARHKDGGEVEVEISLGRIETAQGFLFVSALRDITAPKRAAAALHEKESRYRSLVQNSPLCIHEIALDGTISSINGAGLAMMSASDECELQGRPYLDAVCTADRARIGALLTRAHAGETSHFEFRANGPSGRIFKSCFVPIRNPDNSVARLMGISEDITEHKRAEERIKVLAFFDQLTGLPNRTLLQDRLKQAMTTSGRSGNHGALLFIDLDNFKTLNDTLGHDVGDTLLKQVAQGLTRSVREGDTVARLGGDEFVVIVSGLAASVNEAAAATEIIAKKLLATLDQRYTLGSVVHHSTASIGATLFKGNATSVDDLMKQTDLTMYKSKAAGRNTFRFFDPAMEVALKERAAFEEDLRKAVDARQFVLHYQAQVTGIDRLIGAEALVRWKHPQRGMVSPVEFIPLAEETGLILPLGRWVLETACRQLAGWAGRSDMAHLTMAVNVSAHQFRQPDFVDQVLSVLLDTGANPLRLKLELTESLLVENVGEIIEKMYALKAKGVGFSLDDFGTGYSSLTYLKRLPLDQLKIDRSFVADVLIDPNDAAIARTIVAFAQTLGLGVIAEGVETEAQRDFLAANGCHAYQGYLFGRPLPLEEFEQMARQGA